MPPHACAEELAPWSRRSLTEPLGAAALLMQYPGEAHQWLLVAGDAPTGANDRGDVRTCQQHCRAVDLRLRRPGARPRTAAAARGTRLRQRACGMAATIVPDSSGGSCIRGRRRRLLPGEAVAGGSGEAAAGCTEEMATEGLEEAAAALIPGEVGDDGRRGVSTHIRKWVVGKDEVCSAWSFFSPPHSTLYRSSLRLNFLKFR
jgi:hypothetical protein